MSTWFVTGCSSGLGRALADLAVARGHNLIATARVVAQVEDLVHKYPDRVLALPLDVTEPDKISSAVRQAERRFGGIDVLINNAGYGYRAAVEEGDEDGVAELFATNFFGPVALIKAVLPGMRRRRTGAIVNISSIGARTSPSGSGYYSATKAALEALTLSLRKEVESLGITAMIVEPGRFRTDFAGRSLAGSRVAIADYSATAGPRRKENDRGHGTQPGDPSKAAEAIISVFESSTTPAVLVLGPDAFADFGKALDCLRVDLETWKETSVNTDLAN